MTNKMTNCQDSSAVGTTKFQYLGNCEIHIWRMRVAVMWNIILQFIFLFVYVLVISVDIYHPISWLKNCFNVLLSINLWLKLIVLVITIYIQGEVCKKGYVAGPVYHTSKFQKIRHIFSVKILMLLVLHMVVGVTIFWIYSSVPENPQQLLTTLCRASTFNLAEYCLVEQKLFLLLGGLWIGVYYFAKDYIFGSRCFSFPVIQQYKFYRVKAALKEKVNNSIKDSFVPTIIFLILYYTYGGIFRKKLVELLSCKMNSVPIDSLQGLFNIQLICTLWLFSSIFIIAFQMMELLFSVHLTEHCVFPVTAAMLPPGRYMSLLESLKKTNVPIIHHLAYMDLFVLSTKCQQRREEVFTLSHPGGHPHSWNGIFGECSSLINNFTNDLSNALQQVTTSMDISKCVKQSEVSSFHFHSHNMRKLASPLNSKSIGMPNVKNVEYQSGIEIVFNNLQNWLSLKKENLFKKPYVAYLFVESADSRINYLLCQCQPIIWAVQSLAFLCASSLSEDRYGIVQKDLSSVIIMIVNLKQILDKLFKQNLIVKKSFANEPLDVQMKYLLRTSVKRSLYKIAVAFGPYIKELKLPLDVEVQMNNFIAFKEIL